MPQVGSRYGGSIQPITDRRTFARLNTDARLVRSGPLVLRILDDGYDPPRLGFALGRKFGNAVVRNRARRRLRNAFIETVDEHPNLTGTFLVGAGRKAADASYAELRFWLGEGVAAAQESTLI